MTPPNEPPTILSWPTEDLRRRLAARRRRSEPPPGQPVGILDDGVVQVAFQAAAKHVATLLEKSGEVSKVAFTRFNPPIDLEDGTVRLGIITFTNRSIPAGGRSGWRVLLRDVDRPIDFNVEECSVRVGDPLVVN